MRKLLFLLTLSLLPLVASVAAVEIDGIYYNLDTEAKTAEVTYGYYYGSYSGEINIPEAVVYVGGEYSVTSIGEDTFRYCSSLTSVTIPNSVTSIGSWAFYGCGGLTSVTIPNSVTCIENYAFSWCESLTSVTIPNSVTSIGQSVFSGCGNLVSVIVRSGNLTYDSRDNCNAIIETSTNTLIAGCKNSTIPNSVTIIGSWAFSGCIGLTSVTIPNSVTSIGDAAFYGCSDLTSVTIPNGVLSIGSTAFYGCSGMTSLTIPNSVGSIGYEAFYDCTGLTSVISKIVEPGLFISLFSDVTYKNATLYVRKGFKVRYEELDTWNKFQNIVEIDNKPVPGYEPESEIITFADPNVKALCVFYWDTDGDGELCMDEAAAVTGFWKVFMNNEKITSFDEFQYFTGLTSINIWAFKYCIGLASLSIPKNVTSVGQEAFEGCGGLTSINIPDGVTSIDYGAFMSCSGLTSVSIPNSVTSIGQAAFYYCTSLKSVTIGNSVTSIGEHTFSGCHNLSDVYCMGAEVPLTGDYGDYVFGEIDLSKVALYVPIGCKDKYAAVEPWKSFKEIIEIDPDEWDPNKLPTPDVNTFKATDITQTSFVARWDAVPNATKYDINVKLASDKEYTNSGLATSQTYYKITGLTPNTSYQFQVRARNDDRTQTSNWSTSIPTAVTTLEAGTGSAGISIYGITGFDGTDPLVVGNTYYYKVYVVNNSSSDWIGAFYLKDGDTVLHRWHKVSLPKDGKSVQPLEFDYKPNSIGSKTLTLYCQTSVSEGGFSVNAGDGDNPITVEVITDPSVYDGLSLKSAIVCPESLELGQKGTISVEVQNTGNKDWYGTLYLTDDNASIGSVENLYAGESKTISTTEWNPDFIGTHSIAVYYESKNYNNKQLVSDNGFSNPVNTSVVRKKIELTDNTIKLKCLTKELAPQSVTEGTEVYYHYRVTDMNDNPIYGIKAVFSPVLNNSIKVYTNESDDDGYMTLCLKTEGDEAVALPGSSVTLSCVDVIYDNEQHLEIYGANSNDHDVSLKVQNKTTFENAEKVALTIDLGLSATANLTNYLKGKASVSVPIQFGWKYDDDNNFSNYILGVGVKGQIGCTADLGKTLLKLKGVEFRGEAAIGYESSYQSERFKPAIWALVYNICNLMPPAIDWRLKFGADVYKAWYEESDIEKPVVTQNGYVNLSAGGGFDYTFDYPTAPGLENKIARLPQNVGITDFKTKGNVAYKWAFNKKKEDWATKETTYCNSTSLKFNVEADVKREVKNDLFLSKSFWLNSSINDFYQSKILYFLNYKSLEVDKDFTLSFKEDEEYSDERKMYLNKASHEISMTSGYELSVDEFELKGGWTPIGGSLRYSNTCSSKVTLGNEFLKYLRNKVINNDKEKDVICSAVPALSSETLISEPQLIFNTWKYDYLKPLTKICIPNATDFSLKESMKVEQTNTSKFGLSVNIPIYDFKFAKLSLDLGAEVELENRPSVSYYSVENNRFFPVVLRPSTSVSGVVKELTKSFTEDYVGKSYEDHEESLNAKWTFMNNSQYGTGFVNNDIPLTFSTMDMGHNSIVNTRTGELYNFIKTRHPGLAEKKQEEICTFTFVINDEIKNFYKDTDLEFSHFYPAGDLLGVTDKGDTLFVVSEVCNLIAMQDTDTLQVAQSGQFKLQTTIGVDDLTPFGLSGNTPLDVYYSEEGSNIWHYVGPAGTSILTDKFGAYMMGTSIKNDDIAPEILADFDEQTGVLFIKVNENVGLIHKTLEVFVNGIVKDYNVINESCFEVVLSEEEMQYRINLDVMIKDLAGNQGRLSQIFQLDKPEKIDANNLLDTDVSKMKNAIYIEPVSAVSGGSLILSVKMKNKVDAEGFQFDLELPEGVTVAKNTDGSPEVYLSSERTTANKTDYFDSSFLENGTLRVKAGSSNGSAIDGNDGEVAIIRLNVANNVSEGTYPIVLRNIVISDKNSDSHKVDHVKSTLTVILGESIKISSAKQVTYMSDKNLDFTGYPDLKAYVATGYDKSSGTIWLTRVKEVPANTGFLLMGEANTYEIPVKAGELSAYYQNMFKGTLEATTIYTTDGNYTNYYLSNGESGVGFYKVTKAEGVSLAANRAYLSVPTEIPAVGAAGSTETIKVSSAGQVPYYNSASLDFSSLDAQGVKAYTATGYDYNSGTIWLTRVKQVPAETGILIMAPQGEYPVPTASVASVYANMFKGTLTGTTIQTHETIAGEDYINYYLSSGDAGVGFYKVTKEGGVTIGANRCYLPIKNKDAAGTRSAGSGKNQIAFEEADEVIGIPLFRGIGDENDGTTNLTPALSKGEGEGEWYTLQGQRVAKPGKGLYIRNGKKVVIR